MSRNFTITTPADTVRLGTGGQGSMVFTVANSAATPNSGMAKLVPLGDTKLEWLTLSGEPTREFPAGGTHQFSVNANVPQGTPAGRYTWRFDVVSARRAGEERDEGPIVGFEVQATEVKKKGVPWWVWAAAAATLLLIGVVVAFLISRKEDPVVAPVVTAAVPAVAGKHVVDGIIELQQAGFKTDLTARREEAETAGKIVEQTPTGTAEAASAVRLTVAVRDDKPLTLAAADQERLGVAAADALRQRFPAAPDTIALRDYQNASMVKAIVELDRLGLTVTPRLQASTPAMAGKVMKQTPRGPAQVAKGSSVLLFIGTGKGKWVPPPGYDKLPAEYQRRLDLLGRKHNATHDTRGRG
ncbi:MAG TPA: hypothetical protein VF618_06060 [Thermoanaerobaculia bacterium]